jgi:hypothetical protein
MVSKVRITCHLPKEVMGLISGNHYCKYTSKNTLPAEDLLNDQFGEPTFLASVYSWAVYFHRLLHSAA